MYLVFVYDNGYDNGKIKLSLVFGYLGTQIPYRVSSRRRIERHPRFLPLPASSNYKNKTVWVCNSKIIVVWEGSD